MLPIYADPTDDINVVKDRMIELLRQGWCQKYLGVFEDNSEATFNELLDDPNLVKVCLLGAIYRAKPVNRDLIIDKFNCLTFNGSLVRYNDEEAKTVDDVINLVRRLQ